MKKPALIIALTFLLSMIYSLGYTQVKRDSLKKDMLEYHAASGDITGVIAGKRELSTLTKLIKFAGLQTSLQSAGPYTLLAPTNQSFVKLGQGKVDSLVKDTAKLKSFLKYHVIIGHFSKDEIVKAITAGNGKATVATLNGGTLQLSIDASKNLEIMDAKGNKAYVTAFDQAASNGVIHSIDMALSPQ